MLGQQLNTNEYTIENRIFKILQISYLVGGHGMKVIFTKALFGCPIYYYSVTIPDSKSGGQPSGKRAQHIKKKNFKLMIGKTF